MRLAVLENGIDGQSQLFTVGNSDINMAGCMVHILKYGSPTGTMRLELLDADTDTLTTADVLLSALPTDYFHGLVRFDLKYQLRKNTNYYLNLNSAGGYSYGTNDFFGIVFADSLEWKGNGGMHFRILKYRNFNRGRA